MSCELLVLYYSRHGSTQSLARQIARGIESIDGCQATLRTVAELDPETPAKEAVVSLDDLTRCDGLALGSPVWFGNMAAPLKHFWDQTTPTWVAGGLIDKPAVVFTSSSSMHGGQESTLHTMMLPLFHHGMMVLGIPYSEPELHHTQAGGTPYGASHLAPDRLTHQSDSGQLAYKLGQRLAKTAKKLKD
ncbi:NAD(P)H:quinone oxidoreductase [Vibrio sp. SCSIO 43136]|uniref:NAD(P)H:quinone oxidoreductase n=1 Tax=Vibrio sp. SCSIO 43136 TaxID=2819101 RepID=UPI0020755512|nr:NAD(P)H:quinone oxidoreductase [Vibrio sp. SCSIO 43136]USD65940.1 NAD(P)H:quinone oxidoreductase [Vibrio sp. SCSIO 43136]